MTDVVELIVIFCSSASARWLSGIASSSQILQSASQPSRADARRNPFRPAHECKAELRFAPALPWIKELRRWLVETARSLWKLTNSDRGDYEGNRALFEHNRAVSKSWPH